MDTHNAPERNTEMPTTEAIDRPLPPPIPGDFQDKVVLVTGGTTGIGRAAAVLFHARGARVIVTGQNPATLKAALTTRMPADVTVIDADVRSSEDAAQVVNIPSAPRVAGWTWRS